MLSACLKGCSNNVYSVDAAAEEGVLLKVCACVQVRKYVMEEVNKAGKALS